MPRKPTVPYLARSSTLYALTFLLMLCGGAAAQAQSSRPQLTLKDSTALAPLAVAVETAAVSDALSTTTKAPAPYLSSADLESAFAAEPPFAGAVLPATGMLLAETPRVPVDPAEAEPPALVSPQEIDRQCSNTIKADVVAFDQVYTYNRFGAFNPGGMIYALQRDTVAINTNQPKGPGNVQLNPEKRPRPIVLRVNEGDCLQVTFTNWLTPMQADVENIDFTNQPDEQPYTRFPIELRQNDTTKTRTASMHVNGLDYVNTPDADDGAFVGRNSSSLVNPGGSTVYTWYAAQQGQYLLFSMGAPSGNEADNGQGGLGLFGSVNVEPAGSSWYRSQVTAKVLEAARPRPPYPPLPTDQVRIDYEATYLNGDPVLNMLKGDEIIYTDLNALIVGGNEDCTNVSLSANCGTDFREFTVIFHDEIKAVQAFSTPDREGNPVSPLDFEVFHGVKDGFGINYGASGLGSIVIANRKRVGPAAKCDDCKFEEFFLESWVNGDPAMVVRTDNTGKPVEALFPDDPSNVHHSYLNDAVRFRNLHIGKETHVFHLHAHQWLQSPRYEDSTYLDSQTISPGASYTYEINYGSFGTNGASGNRNLTPGDAIFHCHLYPHFAQGMWELWRVHDVFENGKDDRRLPDAELGTTPNPAIVPLPNLGLPPNPSARFPGYPFYIAGDPGKRPPQPPLDFDIDSSGIIAVVRDGGLPRHVVVEAKVTDGRAGIEPALLADVVANRVLTEHDYGDDPPLGFTNESPLTAFARRLDEAAIKVLPSDGTDLEKDAMLFHEGCFGQGCERSYKTKTPLGDDALFFVNGMPRKPGAPYADPCRPDGQAKPADVPRRYRAAYIQFRMKVNRADWHDRQARILTLEDDAIPTRDRQRPAEPLFFRANSRDCIEFAATNLIPKDLNLDDFQIFTPTDIMGQHIHLVKFDVTSSDGAGNGWNYEDGTFSPGEVQERVKANNLYQQNHGGTQYFKLKTNPKFGAGPDLDGNGVGDYVGAQTTVQRWWADPLLNSQQKDRTIRTVFTHDHFGPSSHQHHGFYGALVVEKEDTKWTKLNGTAMYTRPDGGPTSFAANIIDRNLHDGDQSFREFNLAFADFAIVYRPPYDNPRPVNPPGRMKVDNLDQKPWAIEEPDDPEPEAISAADPGTQLVNYRNEPVALRLRNPQTNAQWPVGNPRGEVANVFSSYVHKDPYTPVLPAYEKDQTVVRLIQGAQEEQHVFNLHGYKWFFEPGTPEGTNTQNNTGYRNGQQIGISEHFEFYLNQPPPAVGAPDTDSDGFQTDRRLAFRQFTDHLYSSAATDNLWDGQWGILRVFKGRQPDPYKTGFRAAAPDDTPAETLTVPDPSDPEGVEQLELARLPNNGIPPPDPAPEPETEVQPAPVPGTDDEPEPTYTAPVDSEYANAKKGEPFEPSATTLTQPVCPRVHRRYTVNAILARDLLPGGKLVYNQRSQIVDPNAILFVKDTNMAELASGARKPEPLVLRANAGECVEVTLVNKLPETVPEQNSWNLMPLIIPRFNFNQVRTSNRVALHSQLVAVNTFTDDGARVGFNPNSTVGPGGSRTYRWYMGDRRVNPNNTITRTPMEFGASSLRDMADSIKHASHAAIGALVVEPPNSTWTTLEKSDAKADVFSSANPNTPLFREFVVLYQDDLSLRIPSPLHHTGFKALENASNEDDPEDSGMKAFNYRTEPLWGRLGVPITTPPIGGPGVSINDFDLTNILSSNASNPGCGGPCGDPETPIFSVQAGRNVRFRVVQPAGHARQHGFTIFGHNWQFEPWTQNSEVLGFNPRTFLIGSESGIGPTRHVNILTQSGGRFALPGDYLYRTQESFQFTYGGLWGIFRVSSGPVRADPIDPSCLSCIPPAPEEQ